MEILLFVVTALIVGGAIGGIAGLLNDWIEERRD